MLQNFTESWSHDAINLNKMKIYDMCRNNGENTTGILEGCLKYKFINFVIIRRKSFFVSNLKRFYQFLWLMSDNKPKQNGLIYYDQ